MGHGNYANRNLFIIEITFKQLKNQYAFHRINLATKILFWNSY